MPNDNVLTPERRFYFANRMIHIDSLEDRIALVRTIERAVLAAHPGQPAPRASAGVIAAALAVIEADRAQTLTTEHIDAIDNAIKIQRGELTLPKPRAEVAGDTVLVPKRAVELLRIINLDGIIKRASELQEVYRLVDAARAGEQQ
ncbi:TPA: hypothetical protein QDB05_000257 [Burkholderia vietnamiensis]|nr:hypothetical protein [Burkholderia vietnamiensis]